MKIKGLVDEDIVNYKKCAMYIAFPKCSFKCGKDICQNYALEEGLSLDVTYDDICERYLNNSLTSAIVCGGLEPFDTPFDLLGLINTLRIKYECDDDIIIYTGYTEEELTNPNNNLLNTTFEIISEYSNIVIKYGRYIPDEEPHFDEILGVKLASNNQYAKRINE